MKQGNQTYAEAVKYNPQSLTSEDLEAMAEAADTVEQLQLDADELAAHRTLFERICAVVDMPDRWPGILHIKDCDAIIAAVERGAKR